MIRVAGFQCKIPEQMDKDGQIRHVDRLCSRLRTELKGQDADLVVLPELSAMTYSRDCFDKLHEFAEDESGPIFSKFSELARELGMWILYGHASIQESGYAISQYVIRPDGDLEGRYDKIHIAQFDSSFEREYFEEGREPLSFQVKDIRIGLMICYDIRFPQFAERYNYDHDVDLIVHPVAFYRDETFPSWHHFVITRALENQLYLLSLNQAGDGFGESLFSYPWLDSKSQAIYMNNDEQIRIYDVHKETVAYYRNHYPIREDNRFRK